jgi:hypothetical protein
VPLEHQGFIELPPHVGRGGFDHAAVHSARGRCYVAHTANDAVDVIDLGARKYVGPLRRHEIVSTEAGTHTLAVDPARNIVCAFLPETHRAAVYVDRP